MVQQRGAALIRRARGRCEAVASASIPARTVNELSRAIPNEGGRAAAVEAVKLGYGDIATTWIDGLQPDDRAKAIKADNAHLDNLTALNTKAFQAHAASSFSTAEGQGPPRQPRDAKAGAHSGS